LYRAQNNRICRGGACSPFGESCSFCKSSHLPHSPVETAKGLKTLGEGRFVLRAPVKNQKRVKRTIGYKVALPIG
jgi:hypothetical protein